MNEVNKFEFMFILLGSDRTPFRDITNSELILTQSSSVTVDGRSVAGVSPKTRKIRKLSRDIKTLRQKLTDLRTECL